METQPKDEPTRVATRPLSTKSRAVLEMIAEGHSYEQVLSAYPDLSYPDIFAAAREALDFSDRMAGDYADRMARIRTEYPRAYERWTSEEDTRLQTLARAGRTTRETADTLQRQPSMIQSRLAKLGLVTPAP